MDAWLRQFGKSPHFAILTMLASHELSEYRRCNIADRASFLQHLSAPSVCIQKIWCTTKLNFSTRSRSHKLHRCFNRSLAEDSKMNKIFAWRCNSKCCTPWVRNLSIFLRKCFVTFTTSFADASSPSANGCAPVATCPDSVWPILQVFRFFSFFHM